MKRKLEVWMGVAALAGALSSAAAAQSLGDLARQERAKKGPPSATVKEYTNDNLPTSGGLSEMGAVSRAATSPSPAAARVEEKQEDRGKLEAEWRARFKEQKDKIAMLERELALRSNEGKSRSVSLALEYNTKLAEEDKKYQDETNQLKNDLAAAKQQLEDMTDELRRANLPSGWAD